jgi:hypothetical protein
VRKVPVFALKTKEKAPQAARVAHLTVPLWCRSFLKKQCADNHLRPKGVRIENPLYLAVLKNRAFPTMLYFPCTQSCGNNTPQTRRHSSRTELGIELQRIRTASAERMTARVIATHRSPCNKDAIGLPSHSRHREYLKVFDRRSNELSRR